MKRNLRDLEIIEEKRCKNTNEKSLHEGTQGYSTAFRLCIYSRRKNNEEKHYFLMMTDETRNGDGKKLSQLGSEGMLSSAINISSDSILYEHVSGIIITLRWLACPLPQLSLPFTIPLGSRGSTRGKTGALDWLCFMVILL